MKVVHSCTSNSFSGLEAYVLDLVTWQYRKGKDVELFCREGSELAVKAKSRGVPIWLISPAARPGPLLWAKLRLAWRARLKGRKVTLHMHAGGEPAYHLLPLGVLRGRPKTVLHYHIWINHRKTDPWHRLMFSGIDEVWTSSESARAHLAALLPVSRERIRVVPYGRDVRTLVDAPHDEWRRETRARLGLADDDLLGLCVSRIEPIKGVGELFDAFTRIAPKHKNAHLAIVGGPSPANEEARALAEELQRRHQALDASVRNRLHLLGFVSPCEPFMAASDFYVLPSYEECMSLAMLDAAILWLAILGTNTGGTPSIARPDETGVLVPPRDAAALASALDEFYRDPALVRRLGDGARALGPSFDREMVFGRILEWYGTG